MFVDLWVWRRVLIKTTVFLKFPSKTPRFDCKLPTHLTHAQSQSFSQSYESILPNSWICVESIVPEASNLIDLMRSIVRQRLCIQSLTFQGTQPKLIFTIKINLFIPQESASRLDDFFTDSRNIQRRQRSDESHSRIVVNDSQGHPTLHIPLHRNINLFGFWGLWTFTNPTLTIRSNCPLPTAHSRWITLPEKPFDASVQSIFTIVIVTTTKICTKVWSIWDHSQTSTHTSHHSTCILHHLKIQSTKTVHGFRLLPLSGLHSSAGKLLHTS